MSKEVSEPVVTHGAIARRYAFPIAGTLSLMIIENVIEILAPFLLGRAIDGLIDGSAVALGVFFAVACVGLLIGVLRRVYDTRVYGRIYRETAGETVAREFVRDAPVSQVTARAKFVNEFADFFEMAMPMALSSAATLIGSIVMLAVISSILGGAAFAVAVLVGFLFFFSRRKIEGLNRGLNDEMERQVDVLDQRDAKLATSHFGALVRWRIRLSDLEARNFGLAYFGVLALTAVAVYVLIAVEGKSAGQAFAALTYILQFSDAMILLPYTFQEFLRTTEISRRLGAR